MILLLSFLAYASPQDRKATPSATNATRTTMSFVALTPAKLEAAMYALLRPRDGEMLALPPIAGTVGPQADCGVATILGPPERRLGLLLACDGETFRSGPVTLWRPAMVVETFLTDVDHDGRAEIVIVASYFTSMGFMGLESSQANSVLGFDGKFFKHVEEAEEHVRALATPEEVRAVLGER